MACGSCGSRRASNVAYEVTFRDGTTKVVDTMSEARMAAGADTSVDPAGRRKAPSHRAVPKPKK